MVLDVALAVITLATAVKDMVELGEKIRASFEKVSDNLHNAQVMASEISQTINELKEFCAQHSATVEGDKEFQKALSEVIEKFTLFESEILPLIASPSPSSSLLRRVKGGFKAWRNGDQVEARIRQLKEDLKKCQMNFVMISVARMQGKLNELLSLAVESYQVMKQVADVLVPPTTGSFALHTSWSSSPGLIADRNQRIVAFAQTSSSTSTPIWKTPSAIKQQLIRDALFLKGEISSIADSFSYLWSLNATYSIEPVKMYQSPFSMTVSNPMLPTYRNPESVQCDVIMQARQLRNTLENQSMSTSIQEGARDLINLATGLYHTGMYEEAVKMGEWAVCLFRTLVNAREAIYSPYLVQSLQNLSLYNKGIGNDDGALKAIEEAVQISEGLQTASVPVEIRVQYAGVLLIYAHTISNVEDNLERAIELAEQSVKLTEDINGINLQLLSHKTLRSAAKVNSPFLIQLYRALPSDMGVATYASALRVLSDCLMADNQQQKALEARQSALPIYYDLSSLLLVDNMDIELARILGKIADQECKQWSPDYEKVLGYAEDCGRIYRRHAELNPAMYGEFLVNALMTKGNALIKRYRESDALEVWKEVTNIAQRMIPDRQCYADVLYRVSCSFHLLEKHDEAASSLALSVLTYEEINNSATAEQANIYCDLSSYYRLARRFPEAVEAAKKAVNQYRALAFVEPQADKWTCQTGQALCELTESLFLAGDHEAALDEGHGAMLTFEWGIKTNPESVQDYIYSLERNMNLAIAISNAHKAIEHMNNILRQMRQLDINFPEKANLGLLRMELNYAYKLYRLDHHQEARKYMEDLISKWEAKEHPYIDKEDFTDIYMRALITYASILVNEGHIVLGLVHIQKGVDIGKSLSITSPWVAGRLEPGDMYCHDRLAGQTIRAMYMHTELLVKLGRCEEASIVAEEALKSSKTTWKNVSWYSVGALHVVGLAAHRRHAYGRVVKMSQEAVDICRTTDFEEVYEMDMPSLCPPSHALQLLSSGHANSGNLELGLQYGQEAVDAAKALHARARIPSAAVEQYYMEANGHLGAMYLANSRIDEARSTFEETRLYYTEKVKVRPGQSGYLISMLHHLGIIYCSKGRHDEGHAAAEEAKKHMDHLADVLPDVHNQVHIAMCHELATPSLQVLNRMKETLTCTHQADLSFERPKPTLEASVWEGSSLRLNTPLHLLHTFQRPRYGHTGPVYSSSRAGYVR